MTRRTSIISQLGSYFASKGKFMSAEEYKSAEDAPIRFILIKRTIGSWKRLTNMIGDLSQYGQQVGAVVEKEIKEVVTEIVTKEAEPKAPVKKQPAAKE